MEIIRTYKNLEDRIMGGAVAIGNFDGVHPGHQKVIGEAGLLAKAHDIPWVVLSFEPHPRSVFTPDQDPFRITPESVKAREIEALGVDYLVILPFDLEFSKHSAEDFIQNVLVDGLNAKHVICGYNFYFGAKRRGNPDMLLHKGSEFGYRFTCVNPVQDNTGVEESSTRVRDYLWNGGPRQAWDVLGRPFEINGKVVEGDQRGRAIGFATCNIFLGTHLRPKFGVYAVQVEFDKDGECHRLDGVANIGMRPTFKKEEVCLEVHLFDYADDLYGLSLKVLFIDFIRSEQNFNGLEEIKSQIAKDCISAKEILKKTRIF